MTTKLARRAGILAIVVASTTALTGCSGVVGAKMTFNDTEKVKITQIRLSGGHGDVLVRTAAVTETTIQRVVRRNADPGESYRLDGSALVVNTSCGPDCSVAYEITAPVGVAVQGELRSGDVQLTDVGAVDLRLTSGDLDVQGPTGAVRVRATSGDIRVVNATSAVDVQSTSGDIVAEEVAGPVTLKVTSGDVNAALTTANSVTAQTTSGDVQVRVPTGSYRVAATTGSGDAVVQGLVSDPTAKNVINVRTASGDALVRATA